MRQFSRLNGPRLRTAIIWLLAVFVSIVFLPCGVAAANTVTTDFEAPAFHACSSPQPVFAACGTVNGQDGWKSAVPGNIPSLPEGYDQQVVVNSFFGAPASFGSQSLRLSNGYNQFMAGPPEFFYQTYARPTDPAGEGLANDVYTAQFSFVSTHPQAQQDGLFVSVSPDDGSGGRMSYIGLEDTASGIEITFYDTDAQGDFVPYDLGVFARNVPHTIRFWMKFNPGPDNDFVRIAIDGQDAGQCYTTWENFYRSVSQSVPITDTLQFRSTGEQANPDLIGGGYLFDNVSITTGGAGPPTCDLPIEKQADTRTVHPGGLVGYRLTVRNRGRLAERNLLVCDHIPRQAIFVSASRKLVRLGRRRCLLIARIRPGRRAGFHIVLRVKPSAAPGVMDNTGDETPVQPPDVPPPVTVPPGTSKPDVPGSGAETPPPIGKDTAPVGIVRRHPQPSLTG